MIAVYQHIIRQLGCELAEALSLGDSDQLAIVPRKILKDGNAIYEIEGRQLAVEQLEGFQGFHFHRQTTRLNDGLGRGRSMGTPLKGEFSFVLVDFTGLNQNKYKALEVFEADMITRIDGATRHTARISWERMEDQPVEIAKRFFPNQLEAIQKRQNDIDFLQINYTLSFDGVCDFCT